MKDVDNLLDKLPIPVQASLVIYRDSIDDGDLDDKYSATKGLNGYLIALIDLGLIDAHEKADLFCWITKNA